MNLSDCLFDPPEWLEELLDEEFMKAMENVSPWQDLKNDLYERGE